MTSRCRAPSSCNRHRCLASPIVLWLRLLVTIAGPIAVYLSARVVLPGIDPDWMQQFGAMGGTSEPIVGLFSLGLAPVFVAFFLVELAALIVPSWRRLRIGGPVGRAKLGSGRWRLSRSCFREYRRGSSSPGSRLWVGCTGPARAWS